MTPATFERTYGALAAEAGKLTGVSAATILSQWAVETGWGTSALCQIDHNLAGIRWYGRTGTFQVGGIKGEQGTGFAGYRALSAFVADYAHTLNLPAYAAVRAAGSIEAEIRALGLSPWDAGHYLRDGVPGGSVLEAWHELPHPSATYRIHLDAHATVDSFAKDARGGLVDHRRSSWGANASGAPCRSPVRLPVEGSPSGWRPLVVLVTDGVYSGRFVVIAPTHGVHLVKSGG